MFRLPPSSCIFSSSSLACLLSGALLGGAAVGLAVLVPGIRRGNRRGTKAPRPPPGDRTRIGILGGSGPEAGADLFGKVLKQHRAKLGAAYKTDQDGPDVVLSSCPGIGGPRGKADIVPGSPSYERTWRAMRVAVLELAPMVDRFCVVCNQLHCFEPLIRDLLSSNGHDPAMFVSIIAATSEHCKELGPAKGSMIIFGGPVTCDLAGLSTYRPVAEALPGAVVHVTSAQSDALFAMISEVKGDGPTASASRKFEALLRDVEADGVKTAVLACTELPLMSVDALCAAEGRSPPNVSLVDPTELLAAALLS